MTAPMDAKPDAKRLRQLIDMLKGDIELFWASGNDMARLNKYEKDLSDLEGETTLIQAI